MAKKKQTQPSISQDESNQVQSMLTRYHQTTTQLQTCSDEQQVKAALAAINTMPATAQIAFIKALAREQQVDAADVLAALYAFGTLKDARKEAHRSLILLESAKIRPRWEAPLVSPLEASSLQITSLPPRFFKGLITDSRKTGEMQLILCWEMGEEYREVRMLGFLLEFWHDGIKDFFTSVETKRSFATTLDQAAAHLGGVKLKECSLDEGLRLLEEAKAVNTKYGTKPHKDYNTHLPLIRQLIPESLAMQVISAINLRNQEGEYEEDEFDLSDWEPDDIVGNFIEAMEEGGLTLAYQVLAQDSPLRAGLPKNEWIERHRDRLDNFVPTDIELSLLYIRETPKSKFWLPSSLNQQNSEKTQVVEAGWSAELNEMLLEDEDKLPGWPAPMNVYEPTKRHWFWASFTLVQENAEWRIQSMTDEYTKAQELSVEVIKKHTQELDQRAQELAGSRTPEQLEQMNEAERQEYTESMLRPLEQALYYDNVVIKKEPLARSWHEEAAARAMLLGQYEQSLVHLQTLLERFPEDHVLLHSRSGNLQQRLALRYAEEGDEVREMLYLEQAEKSLLAVLALEESVEAHISLAEVLIEQEDRLDEAQSHLLQAKNNVSEPVEEAHIEMHLAEIALKQGQPKTALSHSQRIVELQPSDADSWISLGAIQQDLEIFDEAETSYKRAIELDPYDPEYYSDLGLLYENRGQSQRAIQTLRDGLAVNPASAELHLYLSAAYEGVQLFQQAEDSLEKAERLAPDSETVELYRQTFELNKLSRTSTAQKSFKLTGPKKKKHHH